MNQMSVSDRVRKVVSEQLGVDMESVSADSTLKDFGGDSLDAIEVVIEIEYEFGIEIRDEDAEKLDSVAGIIAYIEKVVA